MTRSRRCRLWPDDALALGSDIWNSEPELARPACLCPLRKGGLGAVLSGLMVLLFLRDWRSALIVVINIPLSLMGAVLALWITRKPSTS